MLILDSLRRLNIGPVTLEIAAGECVSLMGASGSGKSVLLRMIADLDPHDGGAMLAGRDRAAMSGPEWRRQVTYVAPESGWWEERVEPHFPPGFPFSELLAAVGLPAEARDWPVARLSTGERQRLAILRAFHPGNRVLLLDEPTSGLDEASVGKMEQLFRDRLSQHSAIFMVTHDVTQARRIATRHFLIDHGRLEEHRP
jgi:ABC-type multidrug transport system ATPase subunit